MSVGRKQPKTLSGIETRTASSNNSANSRKQPKTLSGIETGSSTTEAYLGQRRKQPKTLSGIETVAVVAIGKWLTPETT